MKFRAALERMANQPIGEECGRYRVRLAGMVLVLVFAAGTGCKKPPPAVNGAGANGAASSAVSSPSSSTAGQGAGRSGQSAGVGSGDQAGSLADRLNAVESGAADKPTPLKLPNWKPFPVGTTAVQVPLRPGLGLTGVNPSRVKSNPGDVPIAAYVEDVSATVLHVHHYNDVAADKARVMGQFQSKDPVTNQPQAEVDHREIDCDITVDRADLATAHNMRDYVCQNKTEHFSGTEPFGVSTEVLAQLRAGQQVDFHFVPDSEATTSIGAISAMMGTQSELPPLTMHANVAMFSCTLHRVEPYDLAFPVMLNDEPIVLPALHAMCSFPDGREGHLYLLDEADNPMKLWGNMGVLPETLQLVRIELPPPPAAPNAAPVVSQMETALAEKKPVEIYGIYFDFNSDVMKPQSAVVLKQIAAMMKKNPDWKLNVSGHTDNIGGDASNLDLSKRRAAAVKSALLAHYDIAAERLATSGYGSSQPVESNDTIEGRARNRRVELQRL
jgi:outer membrane protein OmpA-like peptidoglycan-associated protein